MKKYRIQVDWSPSVKFSWWWVGVSYHLLVFDALCFIKSQKSMQPSTRWCRILFSSRTWHLTTMSKLLVTGLLTMVLLFLIDQITCLTCISIRESTEYCQEEDERHQIQEYRWAEVYYQSKLDFHDTSAVSHVDHFHATLHWCSNYCKRIPIQVLSEKVNILL